MFSQRDPTTVFVEIAGRDGAAGDYRLELREPTGAAAADIAFGDDRSGAFAYFSNVGSEIVSATVNVGANWTASYGAADRLLRVPDLPARDRPRARPRACGPV